LQDAFGLAIIKTGEIMKTILLTTILLACPFAFADGGASVKIFFKEYSTPRVTEFKQELDAEFGRVTTFSFPEKQQEIEVLVNRIESKAVVELKLFDVSYGQRNLISNSRALTDWGQSTTVQTFKDTGNKQPLSVLKISAEQL